MNKRLQNLEENIAQLSKIKVEYSLSDIKSDKSKEWALRYGLFESIQIVIDVSCHLAVHQNLGSADTYSECIEKLREFDIIDEELEEPLTGMVGLRNILIHEYVEVDLNQLYELLNRLDDFRKFAESVSSYFSEEE